MKAIQTFWTQPGQPIQQAAGGWLDPRYHLMSWALSSSLLARHFEKVVLHTDVKGRQILIDELGLPYSEVTLAQEGLEAKYPKKWWVMRKILSYGLSRRTFYPCRWRRFSLERPRRAIAQCDFDRTEPPGRVPML
jgi:hypothetical protein